MKLITRIATIGALLAAGISTASAQSTTRAYNQPNGYWNGSLMAGPSYYGGGYGWNDPSSYRSGFSDTNLFATPGSQEQRDIGNQGG